MDSSVFTAANPLSTRSNTMNFDTTAKPGTPQNPLAAGAPLPDIATQVFNETHPPVTPPETNFDLFPYYLGPGGHPVRCGVIKPDGSATYELAWASFYWQQANPVAPVPSAGVDVAHLPPVLRQIWDSGTISAEDLPAIADGQGFKLVNGIYVLKDNSVGSPAHFRQIQAELTAYGNAIGA